MTLQMRKVKTTSEKTLFPTGKEFEFAKSKEVKFAYWESLTVGILSPLLHLPQMVFFGVILPVISGVVGVVASIFISFVVGLSGRATGRRVTKEELLKLEDEDVEKEINSILRGTGFAVTKVGDGLHVNRSKDSRTLH